MLGLFFCVMSISESTSSHITDQHGRARDEVGTFESKDRIEVHDHHNINFLDSEQKVVTVV